MGTPDDNECKKETPEVLDLSDFVTEVDKFSRLVEPFVQVYHNIDDLRRWRFCNRTLISWLLCNAACIWLTQGALFVLASSLVIGLAGLSLFQVHTQILNKLLPSDKKSQKLYDKEEETGALQTIQIFRSRVIEMHNFLVKCNNCLSYFYSILKWDAIGRSAMYSTQVCVLVLNVILCSARWNCFLFINWFFLCHPITLAKCYRSIRDQWSKRKQKSEQKNASSDASVRNEKDRDHSDDGDDDRFDLDMTDEVGDTSPYQTDSFSFKSDSVPKSRRSQKQQISSESCVGCNVSFASILKTRRYCRHCGNSYCNRCCYQKVPRSLFGATSPAAKKETVLVCNSCHSQLVSQGNITPENQNKQS